MKKFKKLIPALCMLLISAVLMGTSTYAWFSMNKTVTATGMQVKARAEGGIVIKRTITSGDATETSVDFASKSAVKLLPTSTKDAKEWWHAEAKVDTAATAISSSYTKISDTTVNTDWTDTAPAAAALGAGSDGVYANGLYYYVYDSFTITPDAQSSAYTDLWVSQCTVGTTADSLSKSLRIAVVCGDKVVICAPVSGATLPYDVGGTGTNNCTAIDTSASATTALTKAQGLLFEGSTDTKEVKVYAYFEGEDAAHTTDNLEAATLEGLTITVKFSCTSVAAGE